MTVCYAFCIPAKDATEAFEAASHSSEARDMMQAFCVGIYMEVVILPR
jgi:hypothetical protein